jgi:hypothetical protein
MSAFIDRIRGLLHGEPLRAIGYGAGVVVWIVAGLSGRIPNVPIEQAVVNAGAAAALLASIIETARRYVSPAN